jgi:hypothetical protein
MSQEVLKVLVDLCNDTLSSDQARAHSLKDSGVNEPEVGNYVGALPRGVHCILYIMFENHVRS